MSAIKDKLKENRSGLSENSLKTYTSILKNLYAKVFPDDKEIDLGKFCKSKDFLNHLKDFDGSRRKTYLSALVVMCPSVDAYRELMNQDGQKHNAEQKKQTKTQKEEDNWVNQDELSTFYTDLEKEANKLYKLSNVGMVDLQKIQNFIILSLVSGKYIPIRRSLDWTEMKYKGADGETENGLTKGKKGWEFFFNIYKTSRFHNEQKSPIPAPLKKILTKWKISIYKKKVILLKVLLIHIEVTTHNGIYLIGINVLKQVILLKKELV
jgi:hypothetical protein